MGGGTGSSAVPIYNHFVDIAKKLNPSFVTLIMPARWLQGGRGLDTFREEMINDHRIKIFHDFLDVKSVFNNVAIEGGICYFLWDKNYNDKCNYTTHSNKDIKTEFRFIADSNSSVVIRDMQAANIIKKINVKQTFDELVQSSNYFRIRNGLKYIDKSSKNKLQIFGRFENMRQAIPAIKDFSIEKSNTFYKRWKVFVSKADGAAGQLGNPIPARIMGKGEIGDPDTICTETFLLVGPFANKNECENVVKYIATKFFRFMVGAIKLKNMSQDTFRFVPLQNFTATSDIDWSASIEDIDKALYKKYKLTPTEINFIEKMVKPM